MSSGIDFLNIHVPALVSWVKRVIDVNTVIWERQNAPRPTIDLFPYVTLNLLTPRTKVGFRDSLEYISGTNYNKGGQRTFGLSISVYSKDDSVYFEAIDLAEQLQDSLDNPLELETLALAGLAFFNIGDILDTSTLLETGFEPRATLDLTVGVASNRIIDLGAIESVSFTGTYDGQDDELITV